MNHKLTGTPKSGLITLLLIVVVLIGSCKKENPVSTNQVVMQNTAFSPSSITISKNTTVTWTNKDNMTHNVTSDAGLFSSGNITSGSTYSFQFTTSGTYSYRCTIHAGMTGTVMVQ